MTNKEDIAGNPIYRIIARNTLKELHSNLLSILSDHFSTRNGMRTLVVAGQGPEVVPYSTHLDQVEAMMAGGNIAMFDYNPNIVGSSIDALLKPRFDDETVAESLKRGIVERGYELLDIEPSEVIDLRKLGNRKVVVRPGDLKEQFKFADNSVSAFDATLAVHHVTAYRQGLEHVISEVHRILEPGGLVHLGEGIVNMRYQEDKIHKVASDVWHFFMADIFVVDRRNPDKRSDEPVAYAYYSGYHPKVPLFDAASYDFKKAEVHNPITIDITKEGGIFIDVGKDRVPEMLQHYLAANGFKQIFIVSPRQMVLPLIDPGMQEDRDYYLESVRSYYTKIISLNQQIFSSRPDISQSVLYADNKEYGDAARGLFEYYTEPRLLQKFLREKGFRDIKFVPDSHGIWCNITAIK